MRTAADADFEYYPAFLDLRRRRVVVIGGGEIATGKVRGLLPCGPDPLVVIAPAVSALIESEAEAGRLEWRSRAYRDGDLEGAELAFAATDDRALNVTVAAEARRRGIPVLAVDDIPNCDFIAPAVVKRGRLTVAVSTNALSPAMASHVRRKLQGDLPPEWGDLLEVAADVRRRLGDARSRVAPEQWQAALDEELKDLVWQGRLEEASGLLYARLRPELED